MFSIHFVTVLHGSFQCICLRLLIIKIITSNHLDYSLPSFFSFEEFSIYRFGFFFYHLQVFVRQNRACSIICHFWKICIVMKDLQSMKSIISLYSRLSDWKGARLLHVSLHFWKKKSAMNGLPFSFPFSPSLLFWWKLEHPRRCLSPYFNNHNLMLNFLNYSKFSINPIPITSYVWNRIIITPRAIVCSNFDMNTFRRDCKHQDV